MKALPMYGERGVGSGILPERQGLRIASEGTTPHSPLPEAAVRGAVLADVPQLERLMAPYIASGDLLPRSNYDLCRHVKEYMVAVTPQGEIVACGSLKIYSLQLAEVAGLAVHRDWQGAGLGRALLDALVREARSHGLAEVLALTRKPAFFLKAGFALAAREHFPIKVWADCVRCPRNDCCDEIAVTLDL
ncbi:MAG TPA: GNAT family N-acetyltransferase [Gemmatimonadales bacterium]|nr:GNAT family N-acetyltransferase [Gemmatimonadales bacterium]